MIISLGIKCQPRQTVEAVAVLAGQTVVGQTDETKASQTSHTIGNKSGISTKRYPDEASGGQTEPAVLELTPDGEAPCHERGVALVGETNQNKIEGNNLFKLDFFALHCVFSACKYMGVTFSYRFIHN